MFGSAGCGFLHSVTSYRHEPTQRCIYSRGTAIYMAAMAMFFVLATGGAAVAAETDPQKDNAPISREAVTTSSPPAASSALTVSPTLNAEAAAIAQFDISVGEHAADLPLGTVVRVSGLPKGTTLSGGQPNADRDWVIPIWALNDLKVRVSPDASGDSALIVSLVDNNNEKLAERNVALHVEPKVAEGAREPAATTTTSIVIPTLVVPSTINAAAATATQFDVSVGEHTADMPLGTVVRVSGLPKGTTLSGGQANADRGWMVPLWALNDLKIRTSPDTTGDFALVVVLVDNNGAMLAESSAVLHIEPKIAELPREPVSPQEAPVAVPALVEAPPANSRANGNVKNTPVGSARRRSELRLEKPNGIASDKPTRRDEPKRSRVTDIRNPKSGPCILEWRSLPKVLFVGDCPEPDSR